MDTQNATKTALKEQSERWFVSNIGKVFTVLTPTLEKLLEIGRNPNAHSSSLKNFVRIVQETLKTAKAGEVIGLDFNEVKADASAQNEFEIDISGADTATIEESIKPDGVIRSVLKKVLVTPEKYNIGRVTNYERALFEGVDEIVKIYHECLGDPELFHNTKKWVWLNQLNAKLLTLTLTAEDVNGKN